jgi:hypothetical protein
VGPATNVTSLTVLFGILGKRAGTIYLSAIALSAVLLGLAVDQVYASLGLSAQAVVGKAAEVVPLWAQWAGAFVLFLFSVKPLSRTMMKRFRLKRVVHQEVETNAESTSEGGEILPCAGSM